MAIGQAFLLGVSLQPAQRGQQETQEPGLGHGGPGPTPWLESKPMQLPKQTAATGPACLATAPAG